MTDHSPAVTTARDELFAAACAFADSRRWRATVPDFQHADG